MAYQLQCFLQQDIDILDLDDTIFTTGTGGASGTTATGHKNKVNDLDIEMAKEKDEEMKFGLADQSLTVEGEGGDQGHEDERQDKVSPTWTSTTPPTKEEFQETITSVPKKLKMLSIDIDIREQENEQMAATQAQSSDCNVNDGGRDINSATERAEADHSMKSNIAIAKVVEEEDWTTPCGPKCYRQMFIKPKSTSTRSAKPWDYFSRKAAFSYCSNKGDGSWSFDELKLYGKLVRQIHKYNYCEIAKGIPTKTCKEVYDLSKMEAYGFKKSPAPLLAPTTSIMYG